MGKSCCLGFCIYYTPQRPERNLCCLFSSILIRARSSTGRYEDIDSKFFEVRYMCEGKLCNGNSECHLEGKRWLIGPEKRLGE